MFYSGHGVPGLKDGRGYLLPSDAHPNTAEVNGYPLNLRYENLGKQEDRPLDTHYHHDVPQAAIVHPEAPSAPSLLSSSATVSTPSSRLSSGCARRASRSFWSPNQGITNPSTRTSPSCAEAACRTVTTPGTAANAASTSGSPTCRSTESSTRPLINFIRVRITKPGKKPCQNAWVTGLVPASGNIAQLCVPRGRAGRQRTPSLKGDAFARGPAATSRLREGLEAAGAAVFDAPESGE